MAMHCFNYRFKTNERYLNEMERERPLRDEEIILVNSSFKDQYCPPMINWCLIATDRRRATLFSFLRGEPSSKPCQRAQTARAVRHRSDLVIETASSRIDFNTAIYGPRQKNVNTIKFESRSIREEGIFGFTSLLTPRSIEHVSMIETTIKEYLRPLVFNKVCPLCEDYAKLINELSKWLDKKTNYFPVDPIRGMPNLKPAAEGRITKAKMEEDHFYAPNHRPRKANPTARTLRNRGDIAKELRFNTSNYQEHFCDDTHEIDFRTPRKTITCKPMENPSPFATFPTAYLSKTRGTTNDLILEQSRMNTQLGKFNKACFEGPTCL